jgi:predicted dehydrogenase
MKVGVIGTGRMGRNHVRVYSDMRGVETVYLTDIDKESGKEVALGCGAEFVESVDELLSKVDAVSICTPTPTHYEMAKKAIEAKVHCLIEKPATANLEEGRSLIDLASKQEKVIGVGHIERFNPIIGEMKKILKNPRYIEIRRHNPGSARITDTDVVTDLMIHDVDIVFNGLLDGKKEVRIIGAAGIKNNKHDMATCLFGVEKCIIDISASRISSRKIRQIVAEDEEQTLIGDFMTQELFVYRNASMGKSLIPYRQENITEKVLVSKVEPLREELRAFLNSAKDNKEFPVTVKEAVRAMEICEKIKEAI